MRRRFITTAAAVLLTTVLSAQDFSFRELAPGVVAVQGERPLINNSGFIITDEGVIVIDAHGTPILSRQVIAEIRSRTGQPVRTVITTHRHGDHHYGNHAYREAFPGVEFIAHKNTREDILSIPAGRLESQQEASRRNLRDIEKILSTGKNFDGTPLTARQLKHTEDSQVNEQRSLKYRSAVKTIIPPTTTYETSLTLHRGQTTIQLLHFGPGHTRGDTVVWLPEQKIAFVGDLLGQQLWVGGGYPVGYRENLEALAGLGAEHFVFGHGSLKDSHEKFPALTEVLDSLLQQVKAAVDDGLSLEKTQERVDLTKYKKVGLISQWNITHGVERAYKQLTGQPIK